MCRKYRTSDRTHFQTPRWSKREREEWAADSRESAQRLLAYIEAGDHSSAFAVALHIHSLECAGITTPEGIDARRAFIARSLK